MMIETELPTLITGALGAAETNAMRSLEAKEFDQGSIPSSFGARQRPGKPTLGRDVTVAVSYSKPKVWVSIKLHDVTHLDISTQQFGAFFELDFKYEVADMLREVPPSFFGLESAGGPIDAASCTFPWIISNMVEYDLIRENHFFKSVGPRTAGEGSVFEATPEPPVSMYGGCDKVSRWSSPDKAALETPTGRVFKCEQYVMRGLFKLYTVEYLWPWAGAWFMIKVATDERPGAEMLQLLPHHQDSAYPAFEASTIYGYVPVRKREGPGAGLVPDVNYAIMRSSSLVDSSSHSYPKMYMITAARRTNSLEDWLKFYLMPFLSNVFVIQCPFEENDNFVSILATLILAYIALLFTLPDTSSLVFAEQTVLSAMMILLVCGYLSYSHQVDHDFLAAMNVATLFALTVGQWLWARCTNRAVDRGVETSDWAAIASYL